MVDVRFVYGPLDNETREVDLSHMLSKPHRVFIMDQEYVTKIHNVFPDKSDLLNMVVSVYDLIDSPSGVVGIYMGTSQP